MGPLVKAVLSWGAIAVVIYLGVHALSAERWWQQDQSIGAAKAAPPQPVANNPFADEAVILPALQRFKESASHDWEEISIKKAIRTDYSLVLWYKTQAPITTWGAANDTKTIARAVLRALLDAGRTPSSEGVTVWVNAQRRFKGETGKPMVNWYGYAYYDYNQDLVEFKECTGKGLSGC